MKDKENGAEVSIPYEHWLVHMGKMHRVNNKWASVAAATGCSFLIDVPAGVELHWNAKYFSKFGGLLEATRDPAVTGLGTPIVPRNNKTCLPNRLKSKFYYTPTATANPDSVPYHVGIAGGTGVAGTGNSGDGEQRIELELCGPSRWLVIIKPYADAADVILNAEVYED